MIRFYFAFIAILIIFCFSGCESEQNVTFNNDADGDHVDISDLDMDIKEELEEDNYGSRWLTEIPPAKKDKYSKLVFEAQNLDMFAFAKKLTVFDANDASLQQTSGSVIIDTGNKLTDILVPELPSDFSYADLWLDRLQVGVKGGGDGRGSIVVNGEEWQAKGGGDTRGIVLPHLILDKIEGNWSDVTIKITLESYTPPDTALERRDFVKELVESVEVWENGKLVGRGNADKTLKLSSTFGLFSTGQKNCYSERGEAVPCEDSGQDAEWQYKTIFDFDFIDDFTKVIDFKRGLEWHRNAPESDFRDKIFINAIQYCQSNSARIPTIYEFLTICDFGTKGRGIIDILANNSLLWSLTYPLENDTDSVFVFDGGSGAGKILSKSTENNIQCILTKEPLLPHEPIQEEYIDTFAGLMFGEIIEKQKWQDMIDTCKKSEKYGFTDWRVPNIGELVFLLKRLDILKDKFIWSSTTQENNNNMAWILNNDGLWDYKYLSKKEPNEGYKFAYKTNQYEGICVRSIP